MYRILIVYSTQTGRTRQLVDACAEGVTADDDVALTVRVASHAGTDDLLACDGLILATPENFGYMSGALKDFFDRTYDDALPLQLNLPYALFVSAGNDGSNAVREVDRILRGYPMRKIAEPIISIKEPSPLDLEQCYELGQAMAAGLSLGVF